MSTRPDWLDDVRFDDQGLVAAIAQDAASGRVLMMAWMNEAALLETVNRGQAVYWSRSRRRLWHKGEASGHFQEVHDIRLDCDGDAILLTVTQHGGIACHTGRESCFHRQLTAGTPAHWSTVEPVLKDPASIYK
ncbi:MAG: phosphoribosyl-AMP cyclohydrolase [Castellaniella sp.]